jgi:hypothetical protein
MAVVGAALTKVMSFGTLVPLALAEIAPRALRWPRYLQTAIAGLVCAGAVFATYMLVQYLQTFVAMAQLGLTQFGPQSYEAISKYGAGLDTAWPYVARDISLVLLSVVSFRLTRPLVALALTFGLVLVAVFPFITFINYLCVIVVVLLAAIDSPARLRRSLWLIVPTFALADPVMILRDETGLATGIVWAIAAAGVAYGVISACAPKSVREDSIYHGPASVAATAAIVTGLLLVASADGKLVVSSGWHQGGTLTPAVRDIWQAVSTRTPTEALIFTDQTGRDHDLLGGWNWYAMSGQRQVFIASSAAPELQAHPERRDARLSINNDVLAGKIRPQDVLTSRPYDSFFAVVSATRSMRSAWMQIYSNGSYALYRWGA